MVEYGSWEELVTELKGKDSLANVLEKGWEKLGKLDLDMVARNSGGESHEKEGGISICFLGTEHMIVPGDRRANIRNGRKTDPFSTALILHYLINARDISLSKKFISFREIPDGGPFYYAAFRQHAILPLARIFGKEPHLLLDAGKKMNGTIRKKGDAAVTIEVFPRLPLTIIVWEGDDEMEGSATILYDSTAPYHLPIEDLSIIGKVVSGSLRRAAKK